MKNTPIKVSYIELINRFWLMNEVHSFRPNEIALYFYLLKVNNICSWKESFKHNNLKIMAALNIESSKTLNNARNKLQQAGLITFEAKQGNPNVTYSLTSVKITEAGEEVREEVGEEVREVEGNIGKNYRSQGGSQGESWGEVGEEVRAKLGCIKDRLDKTRQDNIKEKEKKEKENFSLDSIWQEWEDFRLEQHKFRYQDWGRQKGKEKLKQLSEGNLEVAQKIVDDAIRNDWKDLYLKTEKPKSERKLILNFD